MLLSKRCLTFVLSATVSCLTATSGWSADEGAFEEAISRSQKTGLPILAVAGSKT